MTVVEAAGLTRRYGDLTAVSAVDLRIAPGQLLALLGPNGAGKTTTIDMISGSTVPDDGRITFDGVAADAVRLRRVVGLCPQALEFWPKLGCAEQLVMVGRLYGLSRPAAKRRAAELLDRLGLTAKSSARAETLSGGMKRRLNVALAMVNDPPILVFDEPEAGLDPQSRAMVRELIAELAIDHGVLLTSHDIAEVERVADRVIIIDHGMILAEGSPAELVSRYDLGDEVDLTGDPDELRRGLDGVVLLEPLEARSDGIRLRLAHSGDALGAILARLERLGIPVTSVRSRPANLEDVFLTLTGRSLRG